MQNRIFATLMLLAPIAACDSPEEEMDLAVLDAKEAAAAEGDAAAVEGDAAAAEGDAAEGADMSIDLVLAAPLEPSAAGHCCFKCKYIPGVHKTQKPDNMGCVEKANNYCYNWFGSYAVTGDQC